MLVKLKQQSLHNALQHVAAGLSARPLIPVLAGIKVQANKYGLTLTASNTSMALKYMIPMDGDVLTVERSGDVVIHARYFMDIIRTLPEDVVTLEEVENRNICIQSGRSVYRLSTINSEEFPDMDPIDNKAWFCIDNDCFKKMVKQVSFAASSSESRMVLTGVLFQTDGASLRLVATDGIRFASRTSNTNTTISDMFPPAVIPAKYLFEYSKMITNVSGVTEVTLGEHIIRFTTDNFTMQSSLINGTYPAVDKLKPDGGSSEITLSTSHFLDAVERVSLLSGDTNVVGLRISQSGAELFARDADIGDVTEVVTFEETFLEPMIISFNGKYMRDIMRVIDSKHVQLRFTSKEKPIIVQPVDSHDGFYIISPVRTPF
ncbi:DNA polymerase III subunit beta [Paenibacillus sp. MBLB4367]|uniref:DNA polymerase III subunit beta n=1 Tax=Paenibacillus sp. MBLB4367 TaxID=3384767 RepID=UPI003907F538